MGYYFGYKHGVSEYPKMRNWKKNSILSLSPENLLYPKMRNWKLTELPPYTRLIASSILKWGIERLLSREFGLDIFFQYPKMRNWKIWCQAFWQCYPQYPKMRNWKSNILSLSSTRLMYPKMRNWKEKTVVTSSGEAFSILKWGIERIPLVFGLRVNFTRILKWGIESSLSSFACFIISLSILKWGIERKPTQQVD